MAMAIRAAVEERREAVVRRLREFRQGEDGALLVFGLFLLFLMLVVGGFAVDVLRYERERTHLQNTADRAVLAAASLSQPQNAQEVVQEYFTKAGVAQHFTAPTIEEGINFRTVRMDTSAVIPTLFMRAVGINTLRAPAVSTASEEVNDVEVSLVVDLSGSMNNFNRLENLQQAAKDFISIIRAGDPNGMISISVVPYTGQVNPGPDILSYYNVDFAQGYSHCIDFAPADFNTTALPVTQTLTGAGHGFPWEYTTYYTFADPTPEFYDCPIAPSNAGLEILPFQANVNTLTQYVDNMAALGATSIDIGMKWGVALLDPSMQPVISGMIDDGLIAPEYEGRPFEFGTPNTLKVVVLMTDGENFEERRIIDNIKVGPSNIWVNDADDTINTYSIRNPATGQFWRRFDSSWNAQPYGNGSTTTCSGPWWNRVCETVTTNNARRLNYEELWHRASMYWIARNVVAPSEGLAGTSANNRAAQLVRDIWTTRTFPAAKDARLQAICNAAKDNDIIIYSIAFEAPVGGWNQVRACASSEAHAFRVWGTDVRSAFRAIARNINELRLME